jgi:endonuclease YncB( thermonuclease family)
MLSSLKNKLLDCDNKTKMFSLEGKTKLCRVVDIYDGDTCKVVFKLNRKIYRWNIRMEGYDSPEMRISKDDPNRDAKKMDAIHAKNYLKSLIMNDNQLIYVKCGEFDKYGRLLGTIFINKKDKISVNEMMINNNFGYVYNGGTKITNF